MVSISEYITQESIKMERYLEFRIDEQTTELKMEAFLKKNAGLTKRQISRRSFDRTGLPETEFAVV